jgi:folate-binding protein YgfZ
MSAPEQTLASAEAYGVIRVQGADATDFLNAQLTRRVDSIGAGESALAAWCNAQGRVQALFRVARAADGEGYALQLPARLVPLALPRLRLFVLRSRVTLEAASAAAAVNRAAEIAAGIPEIYPETREQFIPQMLNLDRLGAIDFRKGCYPGQEIVARTQYRGQLKRRMYRFAGEAPETPLPGTRLLAASDASGTVVDAVRDEHGRVQLLAVIPIEAAQQPWRLEAGGVPLELQTLPGES